MNKRSRVIMIILCVFIILLILSLGVPTTDSSLDSEINDFEQEIVNPENDLDVLGKENLTTNYLLVNIANKIEGVISGVFSFIINLFKTIIDSFI